MNRPTLQAAKRPTLGSHATRRLRKEAQVPVVLYGHQLAPLHLSLAQRDVDSILHGGLRVVDLEIGETRETALLKDVQYDAMGDHILHLDFNRIDVDERVRVTVRAELRGVPKGTEHGGVLDHVLQDLQVECPALDIPEKIRIDISVLGIGDAIHIRDLTPPPGVTFLQDRDAIVVVVHAPAVLAEAPAAAAAEGEAAAEPEVITARREKEEEEAEAES
jgi:large subunit ribosomal protein L25